MHKSYKKTIAILVTFFLIGSFLVIPVSAFVSGSSELIITKSNMWGVGTSTDVPGSNFSNPNSEGVSFQSPFSSGQYVLIDIYYNFSDSTTSNPYGEFALWIYSNGAQLNSSSSQMVLVDGVQSSDFHVGLVDNHITVASNGVIQMPSSFQVRFYATTIEPLEMYYSTSFTYLPFDKSTNDIINNDNHNTDKIIQSQEQLQENEKNEAQGSGNSAADDVTSVMPNKSEGFMNAMQSFVGAMSTTNTDCKIKFPGIKVPALEGFFPDTELLSEQEVDISQAINLIPSAIISLIQAITTVGLIVFCFKELYDTISEALTRRQQNE